MDFHMLYYGPRFKAKERFFQRLLDKNEPTVIRMDGMGFHTFTKPFLRPFDPFFHFALEKSLLQVLNRALEGYYAIVYFQSDEASIILPEIDRDNAPFNGRVEKIMAVLLRWNLQFYQTLLAISTSPKTTLDMEVFQPFLAIINQIRAQKAYKEIQLEDYCQKLAAWIPFHPPSFDCRCLQLAKEEVPQYLEWRRRDAIRNFKNALGRYFYPQKQLNNLSANDLIFRVKAEHQIDFTALPTWFKRGSIYRSDKYLNWVKDGFLAEDPATARYLQYVVKNL